MLLVHAGLFWWFHSPPNSDMDYRIFNMRMWSFIMCTYIYIHSGALSFSHIQRTWVESAQNLTPEIASVFLCAHALFLVLLDHLVREKNMCLECESIQHLFSFQDMFVPFVFFLLDLFWFLPLLPPPSPANPHPALLLPIHIIPPPIIP